MIQAIKKWLQAKNPNATFGDLEDEIKKVLRLKWYVGAADMGMGHYNFCVMYRKNIVLFEVPNKEIAEHIVNTHNAKVK